MLGTGHPWHSLHGGFTPIPIMGLFLSLILLRFVTKLPIGILALGASIALGTLFASAAETWGLTVTIALWSLVAIVLEGSIRRSRMGFRADHPD